MKNSDHDLSRKKRSAIIPTMKGEIMAAIPVDA